MTLPKTIKEDPTQTYRLKKSLYGLRQVGRCWCINLHSFFLRNNFTCCKSGQRIYVLCNNKRHVIVVVYVDDIIIMGNTSIKGRTSRRNVQANRLQLFCLEVEDERYVGM